VKRGEIWLVSLDPTIGSEIQKTRPCIVVSPREVLGQLRTVIVVPLTTGNRPAPFRNPVRFQRRDGLALPEQIRAVDRSRLIRRLGSLDDGTLSDILRTLRAFFTD
jgi:mRNA interferase MazF